MTMRRALPWILAACLLPACSGDDEPPAAAHERQPVQALAVPSSAASTPPTMSAAEAAAQLMDYAERTYPELFPGHPVMHWFAPFAFRHYPASDTYIGVALNEEQGYVRGGVYVLGGPFGATPAQVGTVTDFIAPQAPTRHAIDLLHTALVADPVRNVYYASVPSQAGSQGNRIAVIDAHTGSVSYSAPIGIEPGAMALAADGQSLYVALDGSGELLRLGLPGLQELARVRLPKDEIFYTDDQMLADEVAASPTDPGVVAVSLWRPGTNIGGLVLVRNMVVQPTKIKHPGANQLAFSPAGDVLHGLDTLSTGRELVRFEVLAGGLTRGASIDSGTGWGLVPRGFGSAGDFIVAQHRVWNNDLSLRGTVGPDAECQPRHGGTLLCHARGEPSAPRVLVVDAATLAVREQLALPSDADDARLVLGPGASIALRSGMRGGDTDVSDRWPFRTANRITLVRDESLRGHVGSAAAAAAPIQETPEVSGIRALELPHNAVIADPARGVYYASVPGSVWERGNRVATIDAATGQVSFSARVGSQPGALALAADGQSLYVALNGSGELVRLALPTMRELGRLRLPLEQPPAVPLLVEGLAASPTHAGTVAATLQTLRGHSAPNKVALVIDMTLRSRAGGYAGTSANQLAFGADGRWVYALETATSGFALHRFELAADSLEQRFPYAQAGTGFYWHAFDRVGSYLITRNKLWNAADLSLRGTVGSDAECLPRSSSRLLCLTRGHARGPLLLAVDVPSLAVQDDLAVPYDAATAQLVVGPGNGVALRQGFAEPGAATAARMVLVRNSKLR